MYALVTTMTTIAFLVLISKNEVHASKGVCARLMLHQLSKDVHDDSTVHIHVHTSDSNDHNSISSKNEVHASKGACARLMLSV